MGHEYIHAAFNFNLKFNSNKQDAVAYKWQYDQATRWNSPLASRYEVLMNSYARSNTGMYPWSLRTIQDDFMKLYSKPW